MSIFNDSIKNDPRVNDPRVQNNPQWARAEKIKTNAKRCYQQGIGTVINASVAILISSEEDSIFARAAAVGIAILGIAQIYSSYTRNSAITTRMERFIKDATTQLQPGERVTQSGIDDDAGVTLESQQDELNATVFKASQEDADRRLRELMDRKIRIDLNIPLSFPNFF